MKIGTLDISHGKLVKGSYAIGSNDFVQTHYTMRPRSIWSIFIFVNVDSRCILPVGKKYSKLDAE